MSTVTLDSWVQRLKTLAAPHLAFPPQGQPFRDEFGARRAVDAPFIAWRAHRSGHAWSPPGELGNPGPDVRLWRALLDPHADVDNLLAECIADRTTRSAHHAGALTSHGEDTAIEAWTESELAALHALFWLGPARGRRDLAQLIEQVGVWHLANIQPDNATNRPWGLPVFAWLAVLTHDAGAQLHAETLVHNCQVVLGYPDTLSAHILMDTAEALEEARRRRGSSD